MKRTDNGLILKNITGQKKKTHYEVKVTNDGEDSNGLHCKHFLIFLFFFLFPDSDTPLSPKKTAG